VQIDFKPQETSSQTPLDEDIEHATYEPAAVERYFLSATRAALVLSEFRAPYRGRSTPVNAWWGSFDLAVNLFSGRPAEPPSQDFLMRNAMDSQEIAVGCGRATPSTREPRSTPTPIPRPTVSPTAMSRTVAGTRISASSCSTGMWRSPPSTHTQPL